MKNKTYKIVLNRCYGCFGLSIEATEWLISHGLEEEYWYFNSSYRKTDSDFDKYKYRVNTEKIPRHHPLLVECVETLGGKADEIGSELHVFEIPSRRYRVFNFGEEGMEEVQTPKDIRWIEIEENVKHNKFDPSDGEEI